jgi:hypothetical protein
MNAQANMSCRFLGKVFALLTTLVSRPGEPAEHSRSLLRELLSGVLGLGGRQTAQDAPQVRSMRLLIESSWRK